MTTPSDPLTPPAPAPDAPAIATPPDAAPTPRRRGRARQDELMRFITKCCPADARGCILWKGGISSVGAAIITSVVRPDGTRGVMQARRFLWWKIHGAEADGPIVTTCGQPLCLTVTHLAVRTPAPETDRHKIAWNALCGDLGALEAFRARHAVPATLMAMEYGLTPRQVDMLRGAMGAERVSALRALAAPSSPSA